MTPIRLNIILESRLLILSAICAVFLWISSGLYAQDYDFKRINITNGLNNNTVFCVQQDQKGFIWIGTADGLNRYDGSRFKLFNYITDEKTTSGVLYIWQLLIHSNGTIWVASQRGIFVFDDKTELFTKVRDFPAGEMIFGMIEDATGKVWIPAGKEIYRCEPESRKAEKIVEGKEPFTNIIFTKNKQIWVGTQDGKIGMWNPKTSSFEFYQVFGLVETSNIHEVLKIFEKNERYFWIGSRKGIKIFDVQTKTVSPQLITNSSEELKIRDITEINDNEFWLASKNGIYVLDSSGHLLHIIRAEKNNAAGLSSNVVECIFKDKEGGKWCGSLYTGLNYYPPQNDAFKIYLPDNQEGSPKNENFTNVVGDKFGNIWMAGDKGLDKLNSATGKFEHFSKKEKLRKISGNDLLGLATDGDRLWVGVFYYGIDVLNINNGKMEKTFPAGDNPFSLKNNQLMSIYPSRDNKTVWVGTVKGIYRYDKRTVRFSKSDYFPPNSPFNTIIESDDGTIWGLSDRLYYYNESKKIKGSIKIFYGGKELLPTGINSSAIISQDGIFWIGTGNGLVRFDFLTKKAELYTVNDGLPSNIVSSLVEDKYGDIWVTTSRGIISFSPSTKTVSRFSKIEGYSAGQFSYVTSFSTQDSFVYLSTQGAVVRANPSLLQRKKVVTPICITDISIFNNSLKIDTIKGPLKVSTIYTNNITLKNDQHSFSIEFSTLSYSDGNNEQYAFKMDGLDEDWQFIGNRSQINFTGLSPGKYKLKLALTEGKNIVNESIKTLSITVLYPFYRTNLAYIIYVLLLGGLIFVINNNYKNKLIEKQKIESEHFAIQKEKELYAFKSSFFTDVIHELRSPVTLLQAPLELAMNDSRDLPRTQKYLSMMSENIKRLTTLISELLQIKKAEAAQYKLQYEEIDLKDFINKRLFVFGSIIKEKDINVTLNIETIVTSVEADREALIKIVNNLLDNAFKYCNKNVKVNVGLKKNESKLIQIKIASDGPLIATENREKVFEPFFRMNDSRKIVGTGIGLALSRTLVNLQNGRLFVEDTNEANIFVLELPVKKNIFILAQKN